MCLIYFDKDNKKRYIYIHIPNTGGKLIKNDILKSLNVNIIKEFSGTKNGLNLRYLPYNKLNKFINTKHKNIIYSYVKNPYSRIIELFLKKFKHKKIKDFKNFCKNNISKYIFDLNFNQDYVEFFPQYLFLCDKDLNLKNIKFRKIENKYDIKNYDLSKYFDNHSLKIINYIYKKDFEIFKYDKFDSIENFKSKNLDSNNLQINNNNNIINNKNSILIKNNIIGHNNDNLINKYSNDYKVNNELLLIMIRGHIRNSFDNDNLYNLIKEIYKFNTNIHIYISTFNIVQNNISWRRLEEINTKVNNDFIKSYFKDLYFLIKKIIIIDDKNINLIGNLEGKVCFSKAPLKGWKSYWYNKYKGIKLIKDTYKDLNVNVINFRFDIMSNSFSFRNYDILNFIRENCNREINSNLFLKRYPFPGLDNIYIGSLNNQYELINYFNNNLDEIILKNRNVLYQEFLVYIINKQLLRKYY